MIEMILFLGKSLLAGMFLYGAYHFLMRKESYLLLNRMYLLVSSVLMVVLPVTGSLLPSRLLSPEHADPLPVITLPELVITGTRLVTEEQQQAILNWAALGYALVTLAMITGLLLGIIRIIRFYRISRTAHQLEKNIFLVNGIGSPFSFLGKIYISPSYESHPGLQNIIIHESAHIRQKHMVDLVFLELLSSIFWFNPFFFLIKKAMREVHEYLADREVIRQGVEPITYQQLLFSEVSGSPQYIIANNFNLLTKKRIVMLIKKSSRPAALRIGILLPLILIATIAVTLIQSEKASAQTTEKKAVPAVSKPPAPEKPQVTPPPPPPPPPASKATKPVSADQKKPGDASGKNTKEQGDDVFVVVEDMPQFPGGEEARVKYMVQSIKYPEEARKKGVQGTVYVSYIVEADGSITNAKVLRGIGGACDEEALRVIKGMPAWIPGKQKGKAVRVQFNMPIKFTLDDSKKEPSK